MCLRGVVLPLVLGVAIEMCMVGLVASGDLGARIPTFFLLFAGASLAYGFGVWQRWRISIPMIWCFAILFRLTLLFSEPGLSDDIYRYVWDGRVFANGINPFLYPPTSDALAFLRDDALYPRINHPDLPTL